MRTGQIPASRKKCVSPFILCKLYQCRHESYFSLMPSILCGYFFIVKPQISILHIYMCMLVCFQSFVNLLFLLFYGIFLLSDCIHLCPRRAASLFFLKGLIFVKLYKKWDKINLPSQFIRSLKCLHFAKEQNMF